MKIKISPKEEAKYVTHLVENLAGRGILNKYLNKKFYKLSEEELYYEIKKLHKGNKEKFERIKSFYEKYWKKNGKKYLKELGKIFGHELKDNKMGYISPSLWMNIADVLGRKNVFFVAEEIQQAPLDYLLFHEFTHLYYSDELMKLKLYEAGESPLMEGVDHLILFKSPIRKLFKSFSYETVPFFKANPKFMKELEKIWENRKDFKSFLEKAIEVQRKAKGVVIC